MQTIKTLLIIILLTSSAYTKDIYPTFILKSKGHVLDFVYEDAKLYVANDKGSIEIFDLRTQQLIDEIIVPTLQTTKGEVIEAKVISIDRYKGKTLFVTNSTKAYRNVWLHDGIKLKRIITPKNKMSIKKAKFIDENNYLFGTLGHEIIVYNNQDNYKAYTKHLENSAFTDMTLSSDKKRVLTSSESGRVTLSEVSSGKVLEIFESLNVDNIYKIAYAKETLITAGKDRRVGVYAKDQEPYYIKSDFLVYCAALNPSATLGIYSSGEQNELQLFNIKSGKKKDKLIGHYAIPSTIKFINEKELFSAGYENNIFYWNLYLNK